MFSNRGRWYRHNAKTTVESVTALSTTTLKTRLLSLVDSTESSAAGSLTWRDGGGRETSSVSYLIEQREVGLTVTLFYRYVYGADKVDCRSDLRVVATYPNFGGVRYWWLCPACSRRVLKVYQRGGRWACRTCFRLTYDSTRRDEIDDISAKLQAVRNKLGATGELTSPLPWLKPSYMRFTTYYKLLDEHERLLWRYVELMNNLFS